MEGVFVSAKQRFIFERVNAFLKGELTRDDCAELIGKSVRSVNRIAVRIQEEGLAAIRHGNFGRTPANKLDPKFIDKITGLIRKDYFDMNMVHIREMLGSQHGLFPSYSTLRRICHRERLVKKAHGKKPSGVIRKPRERKTMEGFLLQMDGSPHRYNGRDMWCLIATIDDATSDVPAAEFFKSETSLNCMTVLEEVIKAKGIPGIIYVDKAGWARSGKRIDFGNFVRACTELGIKVIFANSPEAKGRIERWFQVPQDRLVAELRLNNITKMKEANEYLKKVFLPEYWRKQKLVVPVNPKPYYKPLPTSKNLNEIFTMREYRKIRYDHTFTYDANWYEIINPPSNLKNQQIEIRFYRNEDQKFFIGDHELIVQKMWLPTKIAA